MCIAKSVGITAVLVEETQGDGEGDGRVAAVGRPYDSRSNRRYSNFQSDNPVYGPREQQSKAGTSQNPPVDPNQRLSAVDIADENG